MKVTYVDHMGSDLSVVNAARVSFGKKSEWKYCAGEVCLDKCEATGEPCPRLSEKDTKLINYLAEHEHFSPFNHTFITMHVKAPIFVARQLVKHEYMPWNEISRRYVDNEPEFYYPEVWRARSPDKKQGSLSLGVFNQNDEILEDGPYFTVQDCTSLQVELYNKLLDSGVAPEQARMVLPLSTYTEWYWSGTLGAWMKMYNLRAKPDAQLETQEIAKQAGSILRTYFPVSFEALKR